MVSDVHDQLAVEQKIHNVEESCPIHVSQEAEQHVGLKRTPERKEPQMRCSAQKSHPDNPCPPRRLHLQIAHSAMESSVG